jgi:segregation and condensation protein B
MSKPQHDASDVIEHIVPATQPLPAAAQQEAQQEAQLPLVSEAPPAVQAETPDGESPADFELSEEEAAALAAAAPETPEPSEVPESLAALGEFRLRSVLESLFLVSDRPLPVARIVEILEEAAGPAAKQEARPPHYQVAEVQSILLALATEYRTAGRGIELHQVAGGWQLRTAPDNAPWVQRLLQQKPMRLARAQIEVLAIVAYRQPITRPEIDDIRGVDSGGALKTLLERRLVRILGKKEEPGRPLLYGTTREFLEFFNLRDLKELPTLREYYDLSEEHKARVRAEHGDAEPTLPLPEPADLPPVAPVPPPQPERVEIEAQHLLDDAEQLGKIDELIASVSTDFSALNAVLSPPPPPDATAAQVIAPPAAAPPGAKAAPKKAATPVAESPDEPDDVEPAAAEPSTEMESEES